MKICVIDSNETGVAGGDFNQRRAVVVVHWFRSE
jgi:hypothetical protein